MSSSSSDLLLLSPAFQETDIFGITLPIVKHSYVIRDVKKIAHIVSEAFFIARNGRPGPVLIDVPKDVGLEEFTDYRPINQNNIIINGLIRDSAEINSMNIGIRALGTSPKKSEKKGVGKRDLNISFSNVKFIPGHHLYADEDGVIVLEDKAE